MYFRDKDGDLYEGSTGTRSNFFHKLRKLYPNRKIKVRNCQTSMNETKKYKDLMDHSVWRQLGWIAVVGGIIVGIFLLV